MEKIEKNCAICSQNADKDFRRIEIWSNQRWRLTASTYKNIEGFCYLEPKRHIPYITDLDGTESQEFGFILATITKALKAACHAELIYVYIFGGHIPHLHIHLAPHKDNDIYQDNIVQPDKFNANSLLTTSELNALKAAILTNIKV